MHPKSSSSFDSAAYQWPLHNTTFQSQRSSVAQVPPARAAYLTSFAARLENQSVS
jgi:hypothetical protein